MEKKCMQLSKVRVKMIFSSAVKAEHEKHIKVMESAETECEEEKWTKVLKINKKGVTFKLDRRKLQCIGS